MEANVRGRGPRFPPAPTASPMKSNCGTNALPKHKFYLQSRAFSFPQPTSSLGLSDLCPLIQQSTGQPATLDHRGNDITKRQKSQTRSGPNRKFTPRLQSLLSRAILQEAPQLWQCRMGDAVSRDALLPTLRLEGAIVTSPGKWRPGGRRQ